MKEKLEKIVNSVIETGKKVFNHIKENAKVYTLMTTAGIASAGTLEINNYINSPFTSSKTIIKHSEGALEEYDPKDADWQDPQNNDVITSYSKLETGEKLFENEKPVNSTSDSNVVLDTKGSVGGGTSYVNFNITDDTDFGWKNIFAEKYGIANVNDSNNMESIWDIKYVEREPVNWSDAINCGFIPSGTSGVYDQWKIKFFNHADLNRDGKVNLQDYAIFSANWGRDNITKGSDPNALGDYADIANEYNIDNNLVNYGNGTVGVEDLMTFSQEWLWDANDSSTW